MIIPKEKLLLVLALFFLLKPVGIDAYSVEMNFFMNVFRFLFMVYASVLYVARMKIRNASILWVLLLEIIVVGQCAYYDYPIYNAAVYWHSILSLLMMYEVSRLEEIEKLNCILLIYSSYIIVAAILTVYNQLLGWGSFSGTGITFLGQKNMVILYVLPYVWLLIFRRTKIKSKAFTLFDFTTILLSFLLVIVTKSMTSLFSCMVLIGYWLVYKNVIFRKLFSVLSAKLILMFMIFFFYSIVIFSVQSDFGILIENIMSKDLTFTGRTLIWEVAIQMTYLNPYGYGWDAVVPNVESFLEGYGAQDYGHAHNFLLNIFFKSGIFAGICYILFLFYTAYRIDKNKDTKIIKDEKKLVFFIILLIFTFEAYPTNCSGVFFLLYIIANKSIIAKDTDL